MSIGILRQKQMYLLTNLLRIDLRANQQETYAQYAPRIDNINLQIVRQLPLHTNMCVKWLV